MKAPKSMQSSILKRALGDKGFDSVVEQYIEARKSQRELRKPSQNDLKIVGVLKQQRSIGRTAKSLGISTYKVFSAIGRVSAYKN